MNGEEIRVTDPACRFYRAAGYDPGRDPHVSQEGSTHGNFAR
jgi:hypothetical protein